MGGVYNEIKKSIVKMITDSRGVVEDLEAPQAQQAPQSGDPGLN